MVPGPRLAAGGQGEVYALASPAGTVFKRYRGAALATDPALERRLTAMAAHPPAQWREAGSGHLTLAWPSDVVLDGGRFAGFLMPAVDMEHTVGLHRVTNPTDRRTATGATAWTRGFSWRYLVRAAANLARATHALHTAGVVIGDFNESNIRVWHDARVTFLDCDSMQVRDPSSGEWFFCRVGRPEFTPPELQGADWATTVRHPSSDVFALAIHVYQLLLEGEHPFRGVWHGGDDKPAVPELARRGIWTQQPGGPLSPRPAAISASLLPPSVAALFRQAFEDGALDPDARPTAACWQDALGTLDRQLRRCAADRGHFYPADQEACPWCAYALPTPLAVTAAVRGPDAVRPAPGAPPAQTRRGTPMTRRTRNLLVALAAAVVVLVTGIGIALGSTTTGASRGPIPAHILESGGTGIEALAFSPNGETVATGELDGFTLVWNLATQGTPVTLGYLSASDTQPSVSQVDAVAFSSDGKTLATAGNLGTTDLWNAATGDNTAKLGQPGYGSDGVVAAVAFSPNGAMLATGDAGGETCLWNVATKHDTAILTDPAAGAEYAGVAALAFSPDGKTLVVGDLDGNAYVWNVATRHRTGRFADGQSIGGVAFSPDGRTLAAGDAGGSIYLWNPVTGHQTAVLDDPDIETTGYPGYRINAVAFSPDGSRLASADGAGNVYVWDVATGRVIKTFTDPKTGIRGVTAVAFSPDGSTLAAGDSNGNAYLWTIRT